MSGCPAHKHVVFGFRVSTRLANCVGFGLTSQSGRPEPNTPIRFATANESVDNS